MVILWQLGTDGTPASLIAGFRETTDINMTYKQQMQQWLRLHPNATAEEAWEAGYLTSTSNWCRQSR